MAQKKKVKDLDYGNPTYDQTGGLIAQFLQPVYKIIYENTYKFIRYSSVFWGLISILSLLLVMKFGRIDVNYMIIIFIIAIIFEIVSLNQTLIKNILINSSEVKIKSFLDVIEEKSVDEVSDFIISEKLTTHALKAILTSKHKNNIEIYDSIKNTQDIESELIDFLIENKLTNNISEILLCEFIELCKTSLSKNSFEILMKTGSTRLKGVLVIKNYQQINSQTRIQKILYPLFRLIAKFIYFIKLKPVRLAFYFALVVILFVTTTKIITPRLPTETSAKVSMIFYIGMGYFFISIVIFKLLYLIVYRTSIYVWGSLFRNI